MKPIQALLLSLVLLVSGCGYKLGEIRPTPMRSVRTLSVPNFKNETFESRIEVLFETRSSSDCSRMVPTNWLIQVRLMRS